MFTTLVWIQTVRYVVMVANTSQQSQYFQRTVCSEAEYSSESGQDINMVLAGHVDLVNFVFIMKHLVV